MFRILKRVAEFVVFRNVFIAVAAACLVLETRFLICDAWSGIDAFIEFTFFSTFLVYNFHSFSNDSEHEFSVLRIFKDFVNPSISLEQRVCVGIGAAGTGTAFLMLEEKTMLVLLPFAILTMAYSLPVFRLQNKLGALRDIIYVKILTVAVVWSAATTLLPYLDMHGYAYCDRSYTNIIFLFIERFLFIYAITLPFEIRDRHGEEAIGNKTIPIVYGVEKSKMLGYIVLILFCAMAVLREIMFDGMPKERLGHVIALFISAASAGLLIWKTNDERNKWFYKFLVDGTMIVQFILLILLQNLC